MRRFIPGTGEVAEAPAIDESLLPPGQEPPSPEWAEAAEPPRRLRRGRRSSRNETPIEPIEVRQTSRLPSLRFRQPCTKSSSKKRARIWQRCRTNLHCSPTIPPCRRRMRWPAPRTRWPAFPAPLARVALNWLGATLEHALRRETTDQAGSFAAIEVIRQTIAALEAMLANVTAQREAEPVPHLIDALDQFIRRRRSWRSGRREPRRSFPAGVRSERRGNLVGADRDRNARRQDELDEQLLPIFLEEAAELIRRLPKIFIAWHEPRRREAAAGPSPPVPHLKGSARMAGDDPG